MSALVRTAESIKETRKIIVKKSNENTEICFYRVTRLTSVSVQVQGTFY